MKQYHTQWYGIKNTLAPVKQFSEGEDFLRVKTGIIAWIPTGGKEGLSEEVYKKDQIKRGTAAAQNRQHYFFNALCAVLLEKWCDSFWHGVKQSWPPDAIRLKYHSTKIEYNKSQNSSFTFFNLAQEPTFIQSQQRLLTGNSINAHSINALKDPQPHSSTTRG